MFVEWHSEFVFFEKNLVGYKLLCSTEKKYIYIYICIPSMFVISLFFFIHQQSFQSYHETKRSIALSNPCHVGCSWFRVCDADGFAFPEFCCKICRHSLLRSRRLCQGRLSTKSVTKYAAGNLVTGVHHTACLRAP